MRHAFPLGAALGLLGLVAAQPAAAAPQSTPVTGLSSAGQSIAAASDGSMWVSESATPGRVAKIAANGTVTEYVGGVTSNFSASRAPGDVTVTPDGYVWFLMHGGGDEVGGLSMATGAVVRYQLTNGTPTSLAAGPDGKLWMTATADSGGGGFIARYDRSLATTQEYTKGFGSDAQPRSLTPGTDGTLWFVADGSGEDATGHVGQVTSDGTVSFRSVGDAPATLASGPNGMWFTRGTDLGLIGTDSSSLFSLGTASTAIASGPDGAMWSATTGGVIRVTTDGTVTTYPAGIDASAQGTGIAAGADGRMWMTLDRSPYLVRITVPPLVGTATGSASGQTTATVTANVTPNGLATTADLQLRLADGTWKTLSETAVGDGLTSAPVRFDVDGLTAGATNALRLLATNDAGNETSAEVDLQTAAPAPTTPAPTTPSPTTPASTTPSTAPAPSTTPTADPAPIQGATVVIKPTRGTITYTVPGSTTARVADGAASIPNGSTIDTTKGAVSLASQVGAAAQLGTFYGGQFKIKQTKATGMTALYLNAKLDCPAPGSKLASAARAKASGTKRRHVWGADNNGKFQTHGQDSVATVRGTQWLTTDTCAGTVVKVFKGEVSVAPRRGKGKAVIVKAGGRHFTAHVS